MEVPPTRQSALLILSASLAMRGALRKARREKKSQELKAHKNIEYLINDTPYKGLETFLLNILMI